MSTAPVNAMMAIAIALMPLPAMKLLDHLNRGCGDGMCGFFSGLIVLGGLAAVTTALILRSSWKNEPHSFLRLVPVVLWLAALYPLAVG